MRSNFVTALIESVPIEVARVVGTGRCDLLAPNARCAGEDGGSIGVPTFVGMDDVGDNDVVDVDSERLGGFLSSSNE